LYPSVANFAAIALPIPLLAPVITTFIFTILDCTLQMFFAAYKTKSKIGNREPG
jgi:hypothetical protein